MNVIMYKVISKNELPLNSFPTLNEAMIFAKTVGMFVTIKDEVYKDMIIGVHQRPEEQLIAAYNPQLFQHASRPYPPAAAWTSALGAVWPSFEAEEANFSASLGQHYFSPERNTDDDLGTYANRSPPICLLTSPTSNRIRELATIWTASRPIAPPQFLRQTWPSRRRFASQQ